MCAAVNSLHEPQGHASTRDSAGTERSFTTSNNAAQKSIACVTHTRPGFDGIFTVARCSQ
jgi:hypothetical protein